MPNKNRIRTQNRVKAYKPRVRTGCITCRIRHVKCEETKPFCKKCTSTGRKCDGYLAIPSSSSKSFLALPISETQFVGNDLERRSFDFFCQRTVVDLAGLFDPTFWTRVVLQTTHHEPAIKHAVIALGALHENYNNGVRKGESAFAIQQYTKAIGSLVKPIQEKGILAVDVALITCVLFVCFETMRGNHGTAISHIEGGVKIFSEIQPNTTPTKTWLTSATPYVSPAILNPIFIRLDRQVSETTSGRQRLLLDHILDDAASGYHPEIPLIFTTFEQARNSLEHIRVHSKRFVKAASSHPDFADPVKRRLKLDVIRGSSFVRLQQWWSAFESFSRNINNFDLAGQEAIHVLIMHWTNASVVMVIDDELHFEDPMLGDQYIPQYEKIVEHGAAVIKLNARFTDHPGRKRSVFNLDAGIANPLFFVAGACRNGETRWKAIALMRAMDRQEGLINVGFASVVAERIIQVEEEGLVPGEGEFLKANEIPREKRLGGIQMRWDDERGVRLTYCKGGRRQVGGEGYEGGRVVKEEWIGYEQQQVCLRV